MNLKATYLLLAAMIFLPLSVEASEVTEAEGRQIYFSSKKLDPEFKKFVYFATRMDTVRAQFEKNPREFDRPVFSPTGRLTWQHSDLESVLEIEEKKIQTLLNGGSLSDSTLYQALTIWSGMIPGVGSLISNGLQSLDVITKFEGKTPSVNDLDLSTLSPSLDSIKARHPEVYARISEDFKQRFSRSLDDSFLDTPAAEQYKKLKNSADLSEATRQEVAALSEQLKQFIDKQNEQALEKAEAAKFELEKKEVIATFGSLATGLSLLGHPEGAQAFDKMGKIAEIAMDLNQFQMNPMMMVNSYMMIASIAMSMMDNGGAEKALMSQMQKLFEAIEDLREEMNFRFDHVDAKLALIFDSMNLEFIHNQERIEVLRTKLDEALQRIKEIENKIDMGTVAEIKRELNLFDGTCIDRKLSGSNLIVQDLEFLEKCYYPYKAYSSANIERQLLNFSSVSMADINIGRMDRPFQDSFPDILKYVSLIGQHPSLSPQSSDNLVYYDLWEINTDRFLKLFSLYPSKRRLFEGSDINEISQAGKKLLFALQNLVVNRSELRWPVITNLLSAYRASLSQAVQTAKRALATTNPQKFDTSKPLSQPISYKIADEHKKVTFCDANKVGGFQAIQKITGVYSLDTKRGKWIEGKPTVKDYPTQSYTANQNLYRDFYLPKNFESVLPPELLWLWKLSERGTSRRPHFCIDSINIYSFKIFDGSELPKPGNWLAPAYFREISYTGDVKINFMLNNKVLSTGTFSTSFKKRYPFRSRTKINEPPINEVPFLLGMFVSLWYGWDAPFDTVFTPGVFHKLESKSDVFVKGIQKENFENAKRYIAQVVTDGLEADALKLLIDTKLSKEIQDSEALLNLIRSSLYIGIEDSLLEKRAVEAGLDGLLSLPEVIDATIKQDWSSEQSLNAINDRLHKLEQALKQLESPNKDLSPRFPWLEERIRLLDTLAQEIEL